MPNRLFLIESDSPEDSLIAWMLREKDYEVSFSTNLSHDRESWRDSPPDVMLVNAVQPIAEVQHKVLLYRQLARIPIVAMLTPELAFSMRSDNVLSADHFILKPFQLEQLQALLLLAKLNSAVARDAEQQGIMWPLLERRRAERRHERCPAPEHQDTGDPDSPFKVDTELQDVFIAGAPLRLSRKEYALFNLLAANTESLFSDDQILRRLWPKSSVVTDTDVRQYIYRLRRKLESIPDAGFRVETIRGRGYRLTRSVRPGMDKPASKVA